MPKFLHHQVAGKAAGRPDVFCEPKPGANWGANGIGFPPFLWADEEIRECVVRTRP